MSVCRTVTLATLALAALAPLHAQSTQTAPATSRTQVPPPKAVEALIDRFQREFTNIAKAMPAEKYNFTPASLNLPGAQFTGVRTFAEHVKHVAQANYATAANIAGTDVDPAFNTLPKLQAKDDILAALAASFAAVHHATATITLANQNDMVEDVGVGANQSRESLAAWVAVHGYDHYGQLVEYLRMNGIVPKP